MGPYVELRGKDSNLRPPGYEPDELPTALPRDYKNREDRIRTCDPLVPNQVLYQAELLPVSLTLFIKEIRTQEESNL